jgi:urease accessory protein
MQLVSPSLPVGAYAYSQGLEKAIEWRWVFDEKTVHNWVLGTLSQSVMRLDVPILVRLFYAWEADDFESVKHWNAILVASRETSELRMEERHLGQALTRLLPSLDILGVQQLLQRYPNVTPSYSMAFSCAGMSWGIDAKDLAMGYCWSWAENQILSALKLMSLGQTAGQKILFSLGETIENELPDALKLPDERITGGLPGLACASAAHETQFSRLFRS